MQKNNKNASILIWSILISLALGFIFINISTKINLNLKQNSKIKKDLDNNLKIEKNLEEIKKEFKKLYSFKKTKEEVKNLENIKEEKIEKIKIKENDQEVEKIEKKVVNKYSIFIEDYFKILKNIEDLKNFQKRIIVKKDLKNVENGEKLEEEKVFTELSNFKIVIPKEEKITFSDSNDKKEFEFFMIPYSSVKIKIYWDEIIYKIWDFIEKKASKEIFLSEENFFQKIILKKSWKYSNISIIPTDYIISSKKYFQIYEKFWNQEILKKDWFLNIK